MKKLAEAKEEVYQVPNIDLVDYIGYEQYLEEIYVLGREIRGSWMLQDTTVSVQI